MSLKRKKIIFNKKIKNEYINISFEDKFKFNNKMISKKEKKNKNNRICSIKEYEIQNKSISFYEEDDYNSIIYDKSISKDKTFFDDKNEKNYFKTISSTNSISVIKERFNKKNKNIFENDIFINSNSNLNFSYEEKINSKILL